MYKAIHLLFHILIRLDVDKITRDDYNANQVRELLVRFDLEVMPTVMKKLRKKELINKK